MHCCSNCFSDNFLKDEIRDKSKLKGKCSFCGTKDTPVIKPILLFDLFQPVLDLYVASDDVGIRLDEQIQKDWETFNIHKRPVLTKLLTAIYGDKELLQKKYQPKKLQDKDKIKQWNEFREELKHTNRYFPEKVPDSTHLGRLLEFLTLPKIASPKKLYRARINIDNEPFQLSEMGKPPEKKVTNGRANPAGIPYLYTASDRITAIAEVRPYKGDSVTVVQFNVKNRLVLADLRNPKQTISPFELDDDNLMQLYTDMPYLTHLGEELAKPIIPREAALEYLPSQYLCEFTKHVGFHGVIYKSSLEDGDNYAIFDDKLVEAVKVENFYIVDTEIIVKKTKLIKKPPRSLFY